MSPLPEPIAPQIHCRYFLLIYICSRQNSIRSGIMSMCIHYYTWSRRPCLVHRSLSSYDCKGMFTASLPQARCWDTLDIYCTPLSNHYHTPQRWAPTAITDEETKIQRESMLPAVTTKGAGSQGTGRQLANPREVPLPPLNYLSSTENQEKIGQTQNKLSVETLPRKSG